MGWFRAGDEMRAFQSWRGGWSRAGEEGGLELQRRRIVCRDGEATRVTVLELERRAVCEGGEEDLWSW